MTLHTYTPNQCPYQVSTSYTLRFLRYSPDKLFKGCGVKMLEKKALSKTNPFIKSHIAKLENLISKLIFCKLIPYLVDRCICPAPCRSRQTLEKNVLSWALAGTGSVLFIRQVAV